MPALITGAEDGLLRVHKIIVNDASKQISGIEHVRILLRTKLRTMFDSQLSRNQRQGFEFLSGIKFLGQNPFHSVYYSHCTGL